MNPSFLRRTAAVAVALASVPLLSTLQGDAGQSGPLRSAHAWHARVTSTAADGTTSTTAGSTPSEHWQTIELPAPRPSDPRYLSTTRAVRIRT
jgi:hypothetical protein